MYLSKYVRPIVITLAIAVLSASHPAYSQECAAYSWNARLSVRGGCKKVGASCTTGFVNMDPVGKCKTINGSNPYERECWCVGRRMLKRSVTGGDVREVQGILKVKKDGIFGSETEAAVRAFQIQKRLDSDGIVGEKTWAVLHAVAAPTSK